MTPLPELPEKTSLLRQVKPWRAKWLHAPRPDTIVAPSAGQISVWDFPRPPALQPVAQRITVTLAGLVLADTVHAVRIVETAGAPVYYIAPGDVRQTCLRANNHVTICEWKGAAVHFDFVGPDRHRRDIAFCYPDPLDDLQRGFSAIAGWFAFYPAKVDECRLGAVRATPQPGGYYAGWVTPDLVGPIKGTPGSENW